MTANGWRTAIAVTLAVACSGLAEADARSDGGMRRLDADEALLVLPLHAQGEFEAIEFIDSQRKQTFRIQRIEDRLQLLVAKVAPGDYRLSKVLLPKDRFVEYTESDKWIPRFSVRGGLVNYAGDMRLELDGGRVVTAFGGNTSDVLPVLLRREARLAPDLFARLPFTLSAPLDAQSFLGVSPGDAWNLAAWIDAVPRLKEAASPALVTALFERLGGGALAAATPFSDAAKALEALDTSKVAVDVIPRDQRIIVRFDGFWGDRGETMGIELLFVDGRLAQQTVRALADSGLWGIAPPDAQSDLTSFAAGR